MGSLCLFCRSRNRDSLLGVAESWRVFCICSIKPIADTLTGALRELGHEPVAVLAPRRAEGQEPPPPPLHLTAGSAPPGVDLLFAKDKHSIERLVRAYEPDLLACWGFPWKIPAPALAVPRLGSINQHPALLPRHRGPIPLAWALRDGLSEWGSTWHYMDAELDTGNMLAQTTVPIGDDDVDISEFGQRLLDAAAGILPEALARVAAADPGDPQPAEGASWAGHFEDDEYVRIDWSRGAREIHNQVRAWHLTFGLSGLRAPVAELDGETLVVLQTRLTDPGDGSRRVDCGDGPIWVTQTEPA
jgi:methionyl-tRNA formyltransferase